MISKLLFNKGSFIFTAVIASSLFAVSTSAQAADPRELLERMSTELAGLDSFILSGDAYADARLDAGQIIENSSQVTMRVRKPDAMRLTMRNEEGVKEVVFGSGVLTLYSEKDNFYAQTEIPEGLGAAVDVAINDVGIDAPMLESMSFDSPLMAFVCCFVLDFIAFNVTIASLRRSSSTIAVFVLSSASSIKTIGPNVPPPPKIKIV